MDPNGILGLVGMIALATWSWSDRPAGKAYYWALLFWPVGGLWVIHRVSQVRRQRRIQGRELSRARTLAWWAARIDDPNAPELERAVAQEIVDMYKESK